MKRIPISKDFETAFIGPDLEEGPLPAVFYFSLSAEESLNVDPYNQPALHLFNAGMRVFSMDLPAHGAGQLSVDAIGVWARAFSQGKDLISEFVEKAIFVIEHLQEKGYLLKDRIGVMGLSRGAFIACHVASHLPYLRHILGFAPLTRLGFSSDFPIEGSSIVKNLDLENLAPLLFDRTMRFYIGNHDTRVATGVCYHFVQTLAQEAFHNQIRSPQIELFITPSIGHMGHGTSKEIFDLGADWLFQKLR